jgi:acetyl-CoA acetyltransferase
MNKPESSVVIAGVGQSQVARRLDKSGIELTHDAIRAAVADAGLTLDDIDGVSSTLHIEYVAGASDPDPEEIARGLGMKNVRWFGSGRGHTAPIANRECRHMVVYRTVKEGTGAKVSGGQPGMGLGTMQRASGIYSRYLPVGALSAANWFALDMSSHMHRYGTTREQLGWVALTQRKHASLNPVAVYQSPLTMDDYVSARMISTPLCLYDCDVPVDASTAFVYSHVDTVPDLRAPVAIEAEGLASPDASGVGEEYLWARTELKPQDVDVVQFYDGLSPFVLFGLEKFGFCGEGESGPFVEGGQRISVGGELPVNTWGGQLSAGRVHGGVGHVVEAVRQIRGECGARQVKGAQVALMGYGMGAGRGTLFRKAFHG